MVSGTKSLCRSRPPLTPNWKTPESLANWMAWTACGSMPVHGRVVDLESDLPIDWVLILQITLGFGKNLSGRTFRTLGYNLTITGVEV